MRRIISVMAALALAGCAHERRELEFQHNLSADLPKTGVEQQALIGNLFQAYTTACAKAAVAQSTKAAPDKGNGAKPHGKHKDAQAAASSVADPPGGDPTQACMFRTTGASAADQAAVKNYLAAGFALSDYLCEAFFRHVNKATRMRHHDRGEASSVGTLMGTVLSLSHAGAIATGVNTAAFGALDREFQNFDDSYLVAPDLSNLRHLVLAAQDNMRQHSLDDTKPKTPMTMFGAESTILRYADLCSFLGMQDLLAASVKEKADDIDQANTSAAGKDKPAAAPAAKAPVKAAAKKKKPGAHHPAPVAAATPSAKRTSKVVIERALLAPPPPAAF